MRDSVNQCIEQLEALVIELEASPSSEAVRKVLDALALSKVQLPSAQVMALFDLLEDGITPVDKNLVTALLMICESYKRLLYCMAGVVERPLPEIKAEVQAAREAASEIALEPPADQPSKPVQPENGDQAEKADPQTATNGDNDKNAAGPAAATGGISAIRVATQKLDHLIELVGRLMVTYAVVTSQQKLSGVQTAGFKELDVVIDQLRGEIEAIRLVPIKQILAPMHRLVKSLTQKMGKKIKFEVVGDDLELDKKIVESLNEPLVHLLRNAVDHGVESPEERQNRGKPDTGVIQLSAGRRGEHAFLRIEDDGRGLDAEKIQAKAMEKGLWEDGRQYTEAEIYRFIFKSGFSTAKEVTDVSGRGVGMDAVLNAIRGDLEGDIDIQSVKGQGSVFTLTIPLSRSVNEGIVDALVTLVEGEVFLAPSREVQEVFQLKPQDIVQLTDGREAVSVRGEMLGLIRLGSCLGLPGRPDGMNGDQHAIVVAAGGRKAALLVDDVLRQQQAVVTNFTLPLQNIYKIPILGFGMMGESDALVLNVEALLEQLGVEQSVA
jgi:two-component system chemotaxis sensor kinase CheA